MPAWTVQTAPSLNDLKAAGCLLVATLGWCLLGCALRWGWWCIMAELAIVAARTLTSLEITALHTALGQCYGPTLWSTTCSVCSMLLLGATVLLVIGSLEGTNCICCLLTMNKARQLSQQLM